MPSAFVLVFGYAEAVFLALAIGIVRADPRFGRNFAEQTQYVPRSIVAVPLLDERGTLGVLEVLDKRSEASFSLRDIELAGVFARQATVAIRATSGHRHELVPALAALPDSDEDEEDDDDDSDDGEPTAAKAPAAQARARKPPATTPDPSDRFPEDQSPRPPPHQG